MHKTLLRVVAILVASVGPLGAAEPQGEVEDYIASIQSIGDAKSRLYHRLSAQCSSGVCVDNNASEVCNVVAALDVRVGGVIASPGQPAPSSALSITASDLQLMRRIWRHCKPSSWGYWNRSFLLRVTYQGGEKEVAEVSSLLLATSIRGRGSKR